MKVMKQRIQNLRDWLIRNRAVLAAVAFSALAFVLLYGPGILNPCYTDWLLNSEDGDLTQHYLGWKFFRQSDWHFPIGLIDTMAWPNLTSIVFTDSIPLLAVFFKLFRFLLPEQFQYFGWWGLLCFLLQGGVAAVILKKFLKSDFCIAAGSLLFVLSPVFIDRMFWMTSLASHFLCLLGLAFIVYHDEVFHDGKRAAFAWGLLGVLCGSIHIYFLPMCGVLLCGFLLVDAVREERLHGIRKAGKVLAPLFTYLAGAAVAVFLFGGFASGMKAQNDGLGYYSFNLNGFLNPQGWSRILPDLPCTDSQYEGMAYLGAGVLLLLFVAAVLYLGNVSLRLRKPDKAWFREHITIIAYVLIFVVCVAVSASTVVMLNGAVLYELKIPKAVFKLWSIFRATGRLIWPAVYLLVLTAVCLDVRYAGRRVKALALSFCVIAQVVDMGSKLSVRHTVYGGRQEYQTRLPSPAWERMAAQDGIRHICFVSDVVNDDRRLLFSFGDMASDAGMTLSNFYFARSLGEKEVLAREETLAARPEDTVFIWERNHAQNAMAYDLHYYEIDGLIAGCSGPISCLEELSAEMSAEELGIYRFYFGNNQYVNNGEDVDGSRVLHPYGNSYGPYLHAGPGRYTVTAAGAGLTAAQFKCTYAGGQKVLEPLELSVSDTLATFFFDLPEYAGDLECAVWNTGGGDLRLDSLEIRLE